MYAIIETGSKQYRVKEGDTLHVELVDHAEGEAVIFEKVLMLTDGTNSIVGSPTVAGCAVHADVVGVARGPKVRSMTYKKRTNQHRRIGHRQNMLEVKITTIKKS